MFDYLQELKSVLQLLSLPVTGQVRLVEDDCTRIARLTGAFSAARHAVQAEADDVLTPAQVRLLADLDGLLAEVHRRTPARLCSELALRRSDDWRQVRYLSRAALLGFGWPLELPSGSGLAGAHRPN